jgi:hypothetical protein
MISQFYSLRQQATADSWNNRLLLGAEFSNIVPGVFHSGGGEVLASEPLSLAIWPTTLPLPDYGRFARDSPTGAASHLWDKRTTDVDIPDFRRFV